MNPTPRLLRSLKGETLDRPPIWFMRQAGRFLPEYRELRTKAPDFMAFCKTPAMAAEATLQPLRRFPFDAAIVFADILVIPEALGQAVWFEAGEGPRLGELPGNSALAAAIEVSTERLAYVGETLERVRALLEPERALIGFAGGPWTVATYMLEGRSSDRSGARSLAYTDPERVEGLIDILVEATARYLAMQEKAGAQALKIFESWAEQLPEPMFERLVTRPHARILQRLRELGATAPVIGFPRGAGALVDVYAQNAGTDAVALDVQASAEQGRRIQASKPIQGALDPLLLRAGGPELERRIDEMLAAWGQGPYVFNLGHGILPDTPVDHVGRAVSRVVEWRA
ncbi:MAG: uroporphyrinogen decarboxylase [Caulobacteraceae bacterium]